MEETSFTACHMLDGLFRKDDKQHWYGDMSSFNGEVVAWLGCYRGWSG